MTRLRVPERVGRAVGFSPEGRSVRVWVKGMPGADETEVVGGTITEVRDGDAVLFPGDVACPVDRPPRRLVLRHPPLRARLPRPRDRG